MNLRRIACYLLLSTLAGCASFDYSRDVVPKAQVQPVALEGEISIVWKMREPEAVSAFCGGPGQAAHTHACAIGAYKLSERCVIVVPPPKDFNDKERLALLGHEVLHCMGAKHM